MSLLSGQRAWLLQRVTSLYAGLFVLIAMLWLIVRPPADHAAWHALITHPMIWAATALFILLTLLHAWIGLRDVILDYGQSVRVRLTALILVAAAFLLMSFWALWILIEAVLI